MAQGREKVQSRRSARHQIAGFLLVTASMIVMFVLPAQFFVWAAFVSTSCMILVSYRLTKYAKLFRPRLKTIILGLVSAAILYGIFFVGNYGITVIHPLGISATSETTIYSAISSHPLPLQIAILGFDALGFETYFRGNLQGFVFSKWKTFPLGAVFATSCIDALIHIASLNPLWVITTFIADSVWGLTYYYSKDLSAGLTSHFVWDVLIFVLAPIK